MMTRYSPTTRPGFTLIELTLAVAIASFMMFVFNTIFNEATRSMRRGVQTSDILNKARTFNDQIGVDLSVTVTNDRNYEAGDPIDYPPTTKGRMVGPFGPGDDADDTEGPGGVLVIINRTWPGVEVSDAALPRAKSTGDVRDDQLIFFVDNTGEFGQKLPAIAPGGDDRFSPYPQNAENSDFAIVRYGHAAVEGETANNGYGPLASQWVLARHVMLMPKADTNLADNPAANTPTGWRADGVSPADPLVGLSGQVRDGLTDVTAETLESLTRVNTSAPTLAGEWSTGSANGPTPSINSSVLYNQAVMSRLPFTTGSPLVVVVDPRTDDLSAEIMARMHAAFLPNVSDFAIEFAHDYYDNDGAGGNIDMTSVQPDGLLDTYEVANPETGLVQRAIVWYADPGVANVDGTGFAPENPDLPIVFPAPDNALTANPAAEGNAFVWGHAGSYGFRQNKIGSSAGETDIEKAHTWPWMIRIRYRLHDRNGQFASRTLTNVGDEGKEELGQWFETIIVVNRQPPRP